MGLAPWLWFVVRDLHPRLDMVAVALPVIVTIIVFGLGGVAVAARRLAPAVAAGSWLVVGAIAVVGPWTPVGGPPPRDGMRIVEANVLGDNSQGEVADDILAQDPDLVVVTELGDTVDTRLAAVFPEAARSPALPGQFEGDVGLYSRWPVASEPLVGPLAGQRGMRVLVSRPGGAFVVYAVHLAKPDLSPSNPVEVTFGDYQRLIDDLRAAIRSEALPTLLVGDLNLVDRTSAYRSVGHDLSDAMRADWVGPTSRRSPIVPLLARVDQIFMPKTWCSTGSRTFVLTRSDHRGVAVTLGAC